MPNELNFTNLTVKYDGEKLYETLMTCEERLRSEDMGNYYRVSADSRDLNYDKFVVKGDVQTMANESYTSHNTKRLDVDGTVEQYTDAIDGSSLVMTIDMGVQSIVEKYLSQRNAPHLPKKICYGLW